MRPKILASATSPRNDAIIFFHICILNLLYSISETHLLKKIFKLITLFGKIPKKIIGISLKLHAYLYM